MKESVDMAQTCGRITTSSDAPVAMTPADFVKQIKARVVTQTQCVNNDSTKSNISYGLNPLLACAAGQLISDAPTIVKSDHAVIQSDQELITHVNTHAINITTQIRDASKNVDTLVVSFSNVMHASQGKDKLAAQRTQYASFIFPIGDSTQPQFSAILGDLAAIRSETLALDAEVDSAYGTLSSAGRTYAAEVKKFDATARAYLSEAQTALLAELSSANRDALLAGFVYQNAHHMFDLIDGGLVPLESVLDKGDTKVYGLVSLSMFFSEPLIRRAIEDAVEKPGGYDKVMTPYVAWQIGKAACERVQDPTVIRRSQYLEPFFEDAMIALAAQYLDEQDAATKQGSRRNPSPLGSDNPGNGSAAHRSVPETAPIRTTASLPLRLASSDTRLSAWVVGSTELAGDTAPPAQVAVPVPAIGVTFNKASLGTYRSFSGGPDEPRVADVVDKYDDAPLYVYTLSEWQTRMSMTTVQVRRDDDSTLSPSLHVVQPNEALLRKQALTVSAAYVSQTPPDEASNISLYSSALSTTVENSIAINIAIDNSSKATAIAKQDVKVDYAAPPAPGSLPDTIKVVMAEPVNPRTAAPDFCSTLWSAPHGRCTKLADGAYRLSLGPFQDGRYDGDVLANILRAIGNTAVAEHQSFNARFEGYASTPAIRCVMLLSGAYEGGTSTQIEIRRASDRGAVEVREADGTGAVLSRAGCKSPNSAEEGNLLLSEARAAWVAVSLAKSSSGAIRFDRATGVVGFGNQFAARPRAQEDQRVDIVLFPISP